MCDDYDLYEGLFLDLIDFFLLVGKTSVVAPLLALILADGKSLVPSVVPKALVEMSRTRMRETFMRETFAYIMVKRIFT